MSKRTLLSGLTFGAGLLASSHAAAGGSAETCASCCHPADRYATILVLSATTVLLVLFVRLVIVGLNRGSGVTWSLADALSEEVELTSGTTSVRELKASSSRLIAFVGMIVMTAFFLGLAYYVLWSLLTCSKMYAADDVELVLYAGASLFAPYAVNKLSEFFKVSR